MPTHHHHHPSTLPATLTSLSTRTARLLRDLDDLTTYNTETVARYERHAARDDLLAEKKLHIRVALANYSRESILAREAALAKEMAEVQRAVADPGALEKRLKEVVAQVGEMGAAVGGYFSVEVFSGEVMRALEV
ncbi:uncharacterized protein H6S33_004967 [Morchella sextelata]|uniref:uncharacterized protein n=1 Tax=Morchella sextelata TaxID=1174677 RepID=UPI001D04F71F|nr:uncharacterized protein H6S33_004967 [Morchella sextelata]KAH0604985.1 hypothetical protein H6S33_004967 [Morchella sextelata]